MGTGDGVLEADGGAAVVADADGGSLQVVLGGAVVAVHGDLSSVA
jgi:hypothetical protein